MTVGSLAAERLDPLDAVLALPGRLAADPRRPQYHLLPAANWMNDPNGPIFWRGEYHMFYQYNPNGAYWGDMHWGHAVSPDMVHWRHLPVALAPTAGGPDAAGCFSGSALPDGDRVAVFYTGVVAAPESEATIRNGAQSLRESQCLAFASGVSLTAWQKVSRPVIPAPPAGLDVTGFRDPAPWRDGDTWYLAVGSGVRGKGGAVLLYRSPDLCRWEYLHPLVEGAGTAAANAADSGDMWECPDFFPLGGKHVLIHSTGGRAYWQSGSFDPAALIFRPERSGVLDYGTFYAPKTQLDRQQNRILWGWIAETRPEAEYRAAGWAGMMSLPRVLTLEDDGLRIGVAPAVAELRGLEQRLRITGDEDADRQRLQTMQIRGCCGEMVCTPGSHPMTLALVSPESTSGPWLTCRYDPAHPNQIVMDDQVMPLGSKTDGQAELRFYVDGSVIECFAGGRGVFTKRFYYPGAHAPSIGLQVQGRIAEISSLSMWQMTPISSSRLTV